jgi:putative transposase
MELRDGTIRKRLHRWETGRHSRYVTFSTYRRAPVFANDANCRVWVASVIAARDRFGFDLRAWVLMPDHVHMILVPGDATQAMGDVLRSIKQPVAQRIVNDLRRREHRALARLATPQGAIRLWQEGGGFDRNIRDEAEYHKEVAYIHFNPVKRGLAAEPVDYEWSSARWYAGQPAVIELG